MTISVLALAASPRIGGNTDSLLDAFLKCSSDCAVTINKHYLNRLEINPCRHCGECFTTGVCVQQDDMNIIYEGLKKAGAVILASPVYFMGLTAQAKTIIDRCQALWVAKYKLKRPIYPEYRPGVFISAAGQDSLRMFDCPLRVVRSFFKTTQFKLSTSILEPGLDEIENRGIHPHLIDKAEQRGRLFMSEILQK